MDDAVDQIDRDIGRRVYALRTAAGMTLAELADRSGVSRAMLSRIERGESSPTAQLLNRVCAGLGVTLSALFASAEAPVSPLRRRKEQSVWRDPGSGYVRRAVSPPGTGSPTEIVEVEFPAGATVAFESQRLAGADQQVWVLDGRMELTVGETVHRLGSGDCLHMRLDRPIRFRNPFDRAARYVVVLSRAGAVP
jgi:transcriptional regulator with XRE-family HTH domain